jgi:hypothetical protein
MMSQHPLDALALRLSVAERQILIDRAEIAAMRRELSGIRRSRWAANAFAVIGVVAAVALVRSPDPQAQKQQAQKAPVYTPLVVRAPFTVVDDDNMPILKVDDSGPRGLFVYNKGSYAVATLDVKGDDSGGLALTNPQGAIVVAAGLTNKGTGKVEAGPASARTGPGIPPSFILGVKP